MSATFGPHDDGTATAQAVPVAGAAAAQGRAASRGGWRDGLSYGALGLPLAFVALPLYVVLPNHYATRFGVPLATLGALLLVVRLLDAVVDPLIGRWCDRLLTGSRARAMPVLGVAAIVLALGFAALFFPPPAFQSPHRLLGWCAAALVLTYLSFSLMSVAHQAWGARLGGAEVQRARIVSWREGMALLGVMTASVLPSVAGLGLTSVAFAVLLAGGLAALCLAPRVDQVGPRLPASAPQGDLLRPWRVGPFRRLMAVYLLNGIASAVPATLVLFFIRDRLQAPSLEPLFLASYFAAAALSMPLWVRLVARFGLERAWAAGMLLSVAAFCWAALVNAGDAVAYAAVCVASGLALGADLVVPAAMLAGVVQRAGDASRAEGAYFGWWNFATKLNLALAAGLALPLLAVLGYQPGQADAAGLRVLTIAYCLLPCALKLLAFAALIRLCMVGDRR